MQQSFSHDGPTGFLLAMGFCCLLTLMSFGLAWFRLRPLCKVLRALRPEGETAKVFGRRYMVFAVLRLAMSDGFIFVVLGVLMAFATWRVAFPGFINVQVLPTGIRTVNHIQSEDVYLDFNGIERVEVVTPRGGGFKMKVCTKDHRTYTSVSVRSPDVRENLASAYRVISEKLRDSRSRAER
ncbi:MAG: hypothetical protein NTW19_08835 [Planctomycetota bacterium]|nr:hypothetical protein [Planctomycetota bacterium]